jgi:hypothetical protein
MHPAALFQGGALYQMIVYGFKNPPHKKTCLSVWHAHAKAGGRLTNNLKSYGSGPHLRVKTYRNGTIRVAFHGGPLLSYGGMDFFPALPLSYHNLFNAICQRIAEKNIFAGTNAQKQGVVRTAHYMLIARHKK